MKMTFFFFSHTSQTKNHTLFISSPLYHPLPRHQQRVTRLHAGCLPGLRRLFQQLQARYGSSSLVVLPAKNNALADALEEFDAGVGRIAADYRVGATRASVDAKSKTDIAADKALFSGLGAIIATIAPAFVDGSNKVSEKRAE